jgi:hypothetical protein
MTWSSQNNEEIRQLKTVAMEMILMYKPDAQTSCIPKGIRIDARVLSRAWWLCMPVTGTWEAEAKGS